jgi:hypothetical protein
LKVLIAAGGTGGHLYPGIAIAREILREAGNEVLFVGTEQGLEAKVLPKEGLTVRFISVGKLKGMGLGSVLKTVITLPRSLAGGLEQGGGLGPTAAQRHVEHRRQHQAQHQCHAEQCPELHPVPRTTRHRIPAG